MSYHFTENHIFVLQLPLLLGDKSPAAVRLDHSQNYITILRLLHHIQNVMSQRTITSSHGTLDLATHATRKIEQYDSGTDIYNGGTVQ